MFLLRSTRLRRKLLIHVFGRPGESHYVRELANGIQEDPGNLSRELRRLEAEGVLTSSIKGNLKFYTLNREYPLYGELRKIVARTENPEESLKKLVEESEHIAIAFIYGPFARNPSNPSSDIDLFIVGRVKEIKLLERIGDIEKQTGREINVTFYGEAGFSRERSREGGMVDIILRDKIIELKGTARG